MIILFLKALIAGIIIAAPAGPTGILCIRRTLLKKDKSGFFTGYGAATADLIYAMTAGFGLTIVSDFILAQQNWLRLIGGVILIIIGIRGWFLPKDSPHKNIKEDKHLLKDYASGFALTFSNPITILTFFAAYAIIGIGTNYTLFNSIILISGSFLGALIGWTIVNSFVALYRDKISKDMLHKANKIFGTLLILFGIFLLTKLTPLF